MKMPRELKNSTFYNFHTLPRKERACDTVLRDLPFIKIEGLALQIQLTSCMSKFNVQERHRMTPR